MRKIYTCALLLCTTMSVFSQQVVWQKDIRSSTQDFINQVITTIDQQYLITGSSIQVQDKAAAAGSKKKNNGYDFHVIKLNQQGDEVWEKFFSGEKHDFLTSAVATEEGGFLLIGTSHSGKGLQKKEASNGGTDLWLVRINEFGDELWQKTLGSRDNEEAKAVIQTTDLGFFVAANRESSDRDSRGYGSKDTWIIRLDKNGKPLAETLLGGKGLDEVQKMIPTKDGGALLGIYSRSGAVPMANKSSAVHRQGSNDTSEARKPSSAVSLPIRLEPKASSNFGEGDYWIVKLDKSGKVEWEKNYGGNGDDHLRTLAITADGYMVGGESRSGKSGNKTVGIEEGADLWLIALNEKGEDLWQKSYNFKNRDILMSMNILHSADNQSSKGILLGGYTQTEGRTEKDDETFWMLYLDEKGNEQWRKHVQGESRKKEERLADLKLNRDGSIILAGTSADELGRENWKIVKLGDQKIDQLIEKPNIKIYPNPVSDYAYVEIGLNFKEAEIKLYDMSGRNLQSLTTKEKVTKINTQPLVQGAYLIVIKTDTNTTANAKLIKK